MTILQVQIAGSVILLTLSGSTYKMRLEFLLGLSRGLLGKIHLQSSFVYLQQYTTNCPKIMHIIAIECQFIECEKKNPLLISFIFRNQYQSQLMSASSFQGFFTSQQLHDLTRNFNKPEKNIEQQQKPSVKTLEVKCHFTQQSYDCMAGLELNKHIIYAFAKNADFECQIVLYSFRKVDGIKQSISIKTLSGKITCLQFMVVYNQKSTSYNGNQNAYYKLIAGFQDGYVKIIDLKEQSKLLTIRTDIKPIVTLLKGNFQVFERINVCLALGEDFKVYFIDVMKAQIIFILWPNILTCDKAKSITFHPQYSYLMETTQGGYIIFWKLSEIIASIKEKENKKTKLHYSVLPTRINHSLAIEGILWCDFYYNFIVLITKDGFLKIVAFNVKEDEEYIVLHQHKIGKIQEVTSVSIRSEHDSIFIARSLKGNCCFQKIVISQRLSIKKIEFFRLLKLNSLNQFFLAKSVPIFMCLGEKITAIGLEDELFQFSQMDDKIQQQMDDY